MLVAGRGPICGCRQTYILWSNQDQTFWLERDETQSQNMKASAQVVELILVFEQM